MGLLDKLFRGKEGRRDGVAAGSGLDEDDENEATTSVSPRVAPRNEVVQVVLRDTMRKHGIPSDWIECRILSVVSSTRGTGMHVMLLVRQGDDRLVTYVHAFQASFMQELARFDPKAAEWVFSLSWQFEDRPASGRADMPEPGSWAGGAASAGASTSAGAVMAPGPEGGGAKPAEPEHDELEQDLKALFAIRDAALVESPPVQPEKSGFEDTRPGGTDTGPGRPG